ELAKQRERIAEIGLSHGPVERHVLAGSLLQGGAKGINCLMEPRRAVLARAERHERIAEIVLGRGPAERRSLAGKYLQDGAIGLDRLIEPRRATLALAKRLESDPEINQRTACFVRTIRGLH